MPEVRIRDIVAKEGEKAAGFLDVGTTSTTIYRVPLVIFNGVKPGPTLALYGGVHGLEYASIEAVQRVMKEVDPKRLRGTLLAVPVMNQANFESRTAFLSPLDMQNQNRCWPGNPEGTMSYRVTHAVYTEIASKADAQIDLHGGDLTEDIGNPGYVIVSQYGPEKADRLAMELAECFNGEYVVLRKPVNVPRPHVSGSKATVEERSWMGQGDRPSSTIVARNLGIPALVVEAGTPYPVREEQIEFHHAGVINAMKHLRMLEGVSRRTKPVVDPPIQNIICKRGGIFHSFVDWESEIKSGQVVAEVTDIFGNVLDTYEALFDGKLVFRRVYYAVNVGEPLLEILNLGKGDS
jgi:predicted deacylase